MRGRSNDAVHPGGLSLTRSPMTFLRRVLASLALVLGRPRRLEAKLDLTLSNQVTIMGQLEDLAASFSSSLATIGTGLDQLATETQTLHDELAAAIAAGSVPGSTMAALQALATKAGTLASQASALAAANASPAPAPAPAPLPPEVAPSPTTEPTPAAPATEPSST